jgi:serine/threonine protein kinase
MVGLMALMQKKGYIHRDIKPANVLFGREGRSEFKLADFGSATRLHCYSPDIIAGTKEYLSPRLVIRFEDDKEV